MKRLLRVNPSLAALAILLAGTAILRLVNLTGAPGRVDDEGTYVAQAYAVTQWGELAHYTYWYDHPPLGWLQLGLWSLVVGPDAGGNAVAAARYLMVVVAVMTAALLWLLARRLGVSRWASGAAVALFALSPLAIALGRAVYLDNIAVAWLLAAFVLLCSPQHRLSAIFGAAVCFGVAVLTKETLLLLVPTAIWLLWTRTAPSTRRYALAVFAAVFAVALTTYALLAAVRGELLPGAGHVSLLDGIRFQLSQRQAGGSVVDPYSLTRHTVEGWLHHDPVLPVLAAPVAIAGLWVTRVRPIAVGLAILVAMVARPGYLPVPFFIAALPLVALLIAGSAESVTRYLGSSAEKRWVLKRLVAGPALAAGVLITSITMSLWLPGIRDLSFADRDAPMRRAQEWIAENVPRSDRLIVDDALWVDLIREGRDRRNVVWAYKLDTDPQVQAWSPDGWRDYDWVVATPSMRASLPTSGVLASAMAASRPAAIFESDGERVELLRIDPEATRRSENIPRSSPVGNLLATRLTDAADPAALAVLQSSAVDQRVLAMLAVIAATEPVRLEDIPAVDGEDDARTPRRELMWAAGARSERLARFFESQVGVFAAESVDVTSRGVRVRFPLRTKEIGLAAMSTPLGDGPAKLRAADLRPNAGGERLDLVRADGTAAGSIAMSSDATSSEYRAVPAGIYIATTHSADSVPIVRGLLTLTAGAAYSLTLFSGATPGDAATRLVPDRGTLEPDSAGSVRLIDAANSVGPLGLAVTANDTGQRILLADGVGHGLITGYATLPAGDYLATVTAHGHDWQQPIQVSAGESSSLLLTDGPRGPLLRTLSDVAADEVPLDAPTLAVPPDPARPAHHDQSVAAASSGRSWAMGPIVVVAAVALGLIGVAAANRIKGGR